MKLGLRGSACVALVMMTVVPTPASASVPPEEPIELTVVAAKGAGCLPGTYEVTLLAGNEGFRVTYRDFRARVGNGAPPTDFRKNCQLSVQIRGVPSKYSYPIAEVDGRGTADIATGGAGVYRYAFSSGDKPPTTFRTRSLHSGLTGTWQQTDDDFLWAGCHRPEMLTVFDEVRVTSGTSAPAPGFVALESTTYRFGWGLCAS